MLVVFFSRKNGETRVADGKAACFSLFALILHGIIAWHEHGDWGKGIHLERESYRLLRMLGIPVVGFERRTERTRSSR